VLAFISVVIALGTQGALPKPSVFDLFHAPALLGAAKLANRLCWCVAKVFWGHFS
jgi:hypothetical protein